MFEYLDPLFIIKAVGVIGVIAIIFAESGLFFGFFLPGDSLLFTAGLLASQDYISFWFLLFGTMIAAIAGDNVGYAFGAKVGEAIFIRKDSRFFSQDNVQKAKQFYEHHGKKTIILARFIPVVRTFAPILAGVARMKYGTFVTYNVVGGILWTASLATLGYLFGNIIPDPDQYILPIVILIILFSISPGLYHLYRGKKKTP
jgi:membrane-associated protein